MLREATARHAQMTARTARWRSPSRTFTFANLTTKSLVALIDCGMTRLRGLKIKFAHVPRAVGQRSAHRRMKAHVSSFAMILRFSEPRKYRDPACGSAG